MIKREIKKIIEMEKYLEGLNMSQVQNNLIKQDFYCYNLLHKSTDPLFDTVEQPHDRILSLIEHHQQGTYEQLQQLQYRISYMMALDWNYDKVNELKNKYLCQRHLIVNSGIRIKQVMTPQVFSSIDPNSTDPYSSFIRSYYQTRYLKNQFLWEFFDSLFELLQENPLIKEVPEEKVSKQEDQIQMTELINKMNDITDLFRKLHILSSFNKLQSDERS